MTGVSGALRQSIALLREPGMGSHPRTKFAPPTFRHWSFKPENLNGAAPQFPKPLLGRAAVQRKATAEMAIPSSKLQDMAVRMRDMASSLEAQVEQPSLEMQIGYKLLDGAISIPQILKSWDVKGKGEVIKTAMRQNLRNMNFSATAVEVDALFDSWDADKGNTLPDESVIASSDQVAVPLLASAPNQCPKPVPQTSAPYHSASDHCSLNDHRIVSGGSLDLKELGICLSLAQQKAQQKRNAPDPSRIKAEAIRAKAAEAEEAAALADRAAVLEEELEVMVAGINERADLRFGALLQARGVKAKAVVGSWGSSRGEHAGELSKEDFRRAVIRLFKGLPPTITRREKDQGAATERESRPDGMEAALELEIDGVFDMFDADHGGYLDAGEALTMIKTLQQAGDKAVTERRAKEFEARAVRSRANERGLLAMEAERKLNKAQHGDSFAC